MGDKTMTADEVVSRLESGMDRRWCGRCSAPRSPT